MEKEKKSTIMRPWLGDEKEPAKDTEKEQQISRIKARRMCCIRRHIKGVFQKLRNQDGGRSISLNVEPIHYHAQSNAGKTDCEPGSKVFRE